MKMVIFAIAGFAMLAFGATANATSTDYDDYGCDYECQSPMPEPTLMPEMAPTPDFIDPWLLIKNRVLQKDMPAARVARACPGDLPRDFHKDIGGITLDPDRWTPLECVRARFERIRAMMAR